MVFSDVMRSFKPKPNSPTNLATRSSFWEAVSIAAILSPPDHDDHDEITNQTQQLLQLETVENGSL
jgi:hypothetical protein